MYRSAAVFLSLLIAGAASGAEEPTRYVRDWISVPLHATPAVDSKTVHNGVVSGTAVRILETDGSKEYSRVRTSEGVEGWIATRYLSAEPAARTQLEKANAELEPLRKLKAQLDDLPADARAATQQAIDLRSENTRLQAELENSQKTPSEAAQLSAENTRLKADNATLQQQVATLDSERQSLRADGDQTKFREGALAVIAGMLLALAVRRLWPKKKSEWS